MLPTIMIGTTTISTYWSMLVAGIVAMLALLWKRRSYYNLSRPAVVIFTVLLTICGVSGTKLLYVLENLKETIENGISLGGMSFFGAVFLIPVLMIPIGRIFTLRPAQTMDVCAPCVVIMIALMRVGCFLAGCCGGWEAEFFGLRFHWPTQAIESFGDFFILSILLQKEECGGNKGILYPFFMVMYGVLRFFVEFLRDTEKNALFMSHGQWFAIIAIIVGSIWISAAKRVGNVHNEKEK